MRPDQNECHARLDKPPCEQRLLADAVFAIAARTVAGSSATLNARCTLPESTISYASRVYRSSRSNDGLFASSRPKRSNERRSLIAVPQLVDRDSRRHAEPARQFVPFHRPVLRAEFTGFPNVGNPGIGQANEGRQAGVVRTAELRRHRAHRGIATALAAIVSVPTRSGLPAAIVIGVWLLALQSTDRITVNLSAIAACRGKCSAKPNAWNLGVDHAIRAANLLGERPAWDPTYRCGSGPPESQNRITAFLSPPRRPDASCRPP
jgi:hypothetical protein